MEEINYLWSWECIPQTYWTTLYLLRTDNVDLCDNSLLSHHQPIRIVHELITLPGTSLSYLACKNALLKSFGEFEGFEHEPPVLFVWHQYNKWCTLLQHMSVDRLSCMWASGPKFGSVIFPQIPLTLIYFFSCLSHMISLIQFLVCILSLECKLHEDWNLCFGTVV